MELYFREYGSARQGQPPLVLLHGLFGSSANWHGIARALEADHRIVVPDLRNHGRSSHAEDCSYPAMAADLCALLDQQGMRQVRLVGHSMGAKVAMWIALDRPERVERLVAVDMAPVSYSHSFQPIIDALRALPLEALSDRQQADRALAAHLDDIRLRQYLLQNLIRDGGGWRWRINLEGLAQGIDQILGFPELAPDRVFAAPSLFLYGGDSDYVTADLEPQIRRYFPHARLRLIPGAGHWVYAEQPETFLAALRSFLGG